MSRPVRFYIHPSQGIDLVRLRSPYLSQEVLMVRAIEGEMRQRAIVMVALFAFVDGSAWKLSDLLGSFFFHSTILSLGMCTEA